MNNKPLYERVNQLSDEQRKLLAEKLSSEIQSKRGAERLVAYVSAESDLNIQALKNHLEDHLPNYMIPHQIVQLSQIPKLPNGKVDLKELPSPELAKQPVSEESVSSNEVESMLCKIWEEVLEFEPVGLTDNFFEIGGDSILSIQIVAKAREVGINFTPNQLFQHQTISELAKSIEGLKEASPSSEEPEQREPSRSTGGLSKNDMSELMRQINEQRNKE